MNGYKKLRAVLQKKGACLKGKPRILQVHWLKKGLLTTALADVTTTRIDYPAATGVYHVKTTTAIGNFAVAVRLTVLCILFIDLGLIVRHGQPP